MRRLRPGAFALAGSCLAAAFVIALPAITYTAFAQTPRCDRAAGNVACEWVFGNAGATTPITTAQWRDFGGRSATTTISLVQDIGTADSPVDSASLGNTDLSPGIFTFRMSGRGDLHATVRENVKLHMRPFDSTDLISTVNLYRHGSGTAETAPNNGSTTLIIERGALIRGGARHITGERYNRAHGVRVGLAGSDTRSTSYGNYQSTYTVDNAGEIVSEVRGIWVRHHFFAGTIDITHSGSISGWDAGILAEHGETTTITVAEGAEITSRNLGIRTFGRGGRSVTVARDARIEVTEAGTNKWGVDMEILAEPAQSDNPARTLTADQKSASVTFSGEIESTHGGIRVKNEGPGTSVVTVTGGASVIGTQVGILASGAGTGAVQLDIAGTVSATGTANPEAIKVEAPGTTTVTLRDNFRVNGPIQLNGAGDNDNLVLDVAENGRGEVKGAIGGISSLVKDGMGTARLAGDVSLASGSTASIQDGMLVLRGHLNLGTGTFEVKEDGRFAVEVAGDDRDGNLNHGRVTAGTVTLANREIFVTAVSGSGEAAARAKARSGITIFLKQDGTPNTDADLNTTIVRLLDGKEIATVTDGAFAGEIPASGGGGGGGSGGAALLLVGGGALAYLLWDLGLFDEEASTGVRSSDRGLEYQVRSLDRTAMPAADMILPASGIATSLRAHLGKGIHADFTGTPNLSLDDGRHAQSGSRYGLGLGWQVGAFSTDIGFARATLDTRSTFSNLAGLGTLSGNYDQRHDQLRADARLRIEKAGLSLAPSLSLFGGSVSEEGYTASSPVWLSEVPPVTRNYSGWKAGMTVAPGESLEAMGLRWRPELRVTTARLADGGGEDLEIVQRDRVGAVQLQSRARTTLPRSVHALGGGLTVAGGEDWSLRGGYVAMLSDGDLEHAAVAGFRMRF